MHDEIIRFYFSRDKHVSNKSRVFSVFFKQKLQSRVFCLVAEKIPVIAVEFLVRDVIYAYF